MTPIDRNSSWAMVLAVCLAAAAVGQVGGAGNPIYVEDSPAAQVLVDKARHLWRQDRLAEATALYQQVIEQYPRKLMLRDQGLYIDAVRWVEAELSSDADLLAAYRRVHEPIAQRVFEQSGPVPGDTEKLEGVLSRYLLCETGLEAGLRLAALYLERGNPTDAASVLDELANHADLDTHAARWHLLQAAAGLFGFDAARLNIHRSALLEADEREAAVQLDRWSTQLPPIGQDDSPAAPTALPGLLRSPLWQIGAEPSPLPQRVRLSANYRTQTGHYPIIPSADGDRLYINDGQSVLALNRSSGRLLWRYPAVSAANTHRDDATLAALRPDPRSVFDRRGVLVAGSRLFAVHGTARGASRWQAQVGSTALVCLDRDNGQLIWRVEPTDLDPSLSRAFFHGTPQAGPGRVFVLVRRMQTGGFQDAFVVAVDAGSGKLIWRRHLSSSAPANRSSTQPLTQMIVRHGRLFVADQLGTVAYVDGRRGAVVWMSLMDKAASPRATALAQAARRVMVWHTSPPVLVEAGLVVAGTGTAAPPVLLDPATGRQIRELPEPAFSQATYLAHAANNVLSIGRTVHLIDGRTLQPIWSRDLGQLPRDTPQGTASVTANTVWLTTSSRLLALDVRDGAVLLEATSPSAGNLLALDGQLVVAGASSVRSYMDWSRAHDELAHQIEQAPHDPEPGLALAHVALSQNRYPAVLEGVDAALAAQRRRVAAEPDAKAVDPLQPRVFAQVRRLLDPRRNPDPTLRRQLLDRLASATAGPADEVAYQLTLANFLAETGDPKQAVDHYQIVLTNPHLSSELYETDRGARLGGLEARWRLVRLVEQHGQEVYARYDAIASQRLTELTAVSPAHAEALVELARQYPLAQVLPQVHLAAAQALAGREALDAAITQYRRAYSLAGDPQMVQAIAGRIVELYDQTAQPQRAAFWLRRFERDHPQLRPLRAGQPADVQAWLAELSRRPTPAAALPSLELPLGQPLVLPARLLVPIVQRPQAMPGDQIVTITKSAIQLRAGEALDTLWEFPIADPDQVRLLALTHDRVLLHLQQRGIVLAIDARTGKPAWPQLDVNGLLAASGNPADHNGRPVAIQARLGSDSGPFVAVNDQVIAVADRLGRALAIDRATGTVLWRTACPMNRVTQMAMADDTLALAGIIGFATAAPSDAIVVLDAGTGEPRLPTLEGMHTILWLGLGGDGMLFHATVKQLIAHHLAEGTVAWRVPIHAGFIGGLGRAATDVLMLTDAVGSMLVIDPATGQQIGRVGTGSRRPGDRFDLQDAQQQWYLVGPDRAMALAPDGAIHWRDAIADRPKNLQAQLIGDKYVVLLGLDTAPDPFGELRAHLEIELPHRPGPVVREPAPVGAAPDGWRYRLYLLDRHGGSIVSQCALGPIPEHLAPDAAVFLDNRLVFTTPTYTIVIPGAGAAP